MTARSRRSLQTLRGLMRKLRLRAGLGIALLAASALPASSQAYRVHPARSRPAPQLTLTGTITVTAMPATVNFTLVSGGTAQASSGISIDTSWSVLGVITSLSLYAAFSSSTAALTNGGTPASVIPSSAVYGQVTTGAPTSYTAFTQTAPIGAAGAGLTLFTQTQLLSLIGDRTDVLNLEINLSSLPSLPAGTYTGTLTLQAQMM